MILKPRLFRKLRYGPHWSKTGLIGLWLLNEGSGNLVADLSGNGNNGIITGLTWQSGKFGSALDGDGTSNYIDCGDVPQVEGVSGLTVSIWTKIPGASVAAVEMLIGKRGEGGDRTFYLYANDSEDVHFGVYNSDATLATAIYTDGLLNVANIWKHIVGVWDGANVYVYVDTVVGGTAPALTGVTDSSIVNMAIGADNVFGQNDWIGTVDNVMIWNRALSVSERTQLFINPFIMFDRDEIDLWAAATQGVAVADIVILRRRREGY